MKKILPFLMALCLLFAAVPAAMASIGLSVGFQGEEKDSDGTGEELESKSGVGQPTGFSVTAQQWILGFHIAAGAQDMTLENNFSYYPGTFTGQHIYDLTFAETSSYVIGLSVLSDDGVAITSCSMRMASAMLRSDELVEASDALWRAARMMIAASEPEAEQEDIEALCRALCPDLPTALIRGEQVEAVHMLGSITCTLSASFEENAFFGDSPEPVDGYIVDFVIQSGAE